MSRNLVQSKFDTLGARLRFERGPTRFRPWSVPSPVPLENLSIDIGQDKDGEFFRISLPLPDIRLEIVDIRPDERKLLLMARDLVSNEKEKFLCGFDERHWFVAAVPDERGVSNIATAMEALKPRAVREEQRAKQLKFRHRGRRKTNAWMRQGEWFFIPRPEARFSADRIHFHEPIRRGRSKPHMVEELVRESGEQVHVCKQHPNGVTDEIHDRLLKEDPAAVHWGWQVMVRNATVFGRGKVRHPDHAVLFLPCWHQIYMNTESQARSMRSVAFLD